MQTAIDYEKYSNMNIRQLTNSLLNAEKKEQKIKAEMFQKLNDTEELIKFLKAKIKENLDKPKNEFFTREQAGLNKIALEVQKQISKEEQECLEAELRDEIQRKYDEL
ncbi:hypothetical protein [Campylobacter upsaliensis]|uniref:hypothetical protein n=2 Tax=Campylobacter upsaliensis TaxID=28080 RepID=UPI00214A87E2|nr:hypothetical protein [Campylobacter upsaliensis]MCR2101546.1 hypothetical protein [Campylobacter upsaliensis]